MPIVHGYHKVVHFSIQIAILIAHCHVQVDGNSSDLYYNK